MEKDIQALEIAKKNLATTKDLADQKKIERTELELKIEVRNPPSPLYRATLNLAYRPNS